MAKQQMNVRVNEKTVSQIAELCERFNMTQAELVGHAVDMYYRHEMSKEQYTVFVINQIDENGNRYKIASVHDELAFQRAIEGKPKHAYPGKPCRSDFTLWQGKPEDMPEIYKSAR